MKETDGEVASELIESLRLMATAAAAMSIEGNATELDDGWKRDKRARTRDGARGVAM